MKIVTAATALLLSVLSTSTWAQEIDRITSAEISVGADTFLKYQIKSESGPPVEYYISRTDEPSPLLVYIQGSGCTPAFLEMQPGKYASTVFSLTTTASKREFAVMIVEKPYAERRRPVGAGVATGCSEQFNAYFTVEHWSDHINRALRHARELAWVDPSQTLLIGVSEGATIAAAVAAQNETVTAVGLVGATGPTQLYDMIALAYARHNDQATALVAIEEVQAQARAILSDPESSTKFAWGHPFRRWSSFMAASSVENLLRSDARIYLVSGMADQSVPISSTEVLFSQLTAAGRDVQFRRIPNAGHDLLPLGADFGASFPQLEAEFARITDWFHAGPTQ